MFRKLTQAIHRPASRLRHASDATMLSVAEACGLSATRSPAVALPALDMPSLGPQLHSRTLAGAPEFTASGGSPPSFTANGDAATAASGRSAAAAAPAGAPEFTSCSGAAPAFTSGPGRGPGTDGGEAGGGERRSWDGDVNAALELVQEAALAHVKQLGWSEAALVAGARDVGVSPAIAGSLPGGGADLVKFFVRRENAAMAARAAEERDSLQGLPLQQRLHTLLRWRLEALQPHLDTWPQALALLAGPTVVPEALGLLNELVDDAWHAAGDRSTDLTWYAKRSALAGVYSATELYMLTDYSANFSDTWDHLDRRLKEMLSLAELLGLRA